MLGKKVEENLLRNALEKFREETGLIATDMGARSDDAFEEPWDTVVRIETLDHQHEICFDVEIEKRVTRETIGTLAYKFGGLNDTLLVTDYVNPHLALGLKQKGIQFIDTCGNIFINNLPIYIYVRGNKKTVRPGEYVVGQRAFRKTGLKVIFACLCTPGLENKPVRHIAGVADVAVGTVDAVFKNLKNIGLLIDKGRNGRKLIHKEKILERWVTAYLENLRPKLIIARYTGKNKYWWKEALLPKGFYWGGENAAAKMTTYLKPEIITVYTHEAQGKLLNENKLRRDPQGEIEILEAFWAREKENIHDQVHPLLVYADLIGTGDDRNLETAKIIFEHELNRFIRTD